LATRTHVTLAELDEFLQGYPTPLAPGGEHRRPLDLVGVARGTVNSSYEVRSAAGSLFLRLYEEQDFDGARQETERLAYLAGRGIVTPAPIRRRDGAFVGRLAKKPAAIFPWIIGDMRCLREVSTQDAYRVGEALARLHVAAMGAPRMPGRFEPEELLQRLDRIAAAPESRLANLATPLRQALRHWVDQRDPDLPRGLIHGDLFRDNVLWSRDGTISALLDFESASDGPLVFDLMVTILAWCFKDRFDAPNARAIISGYTSARALSDAERRGLLAEGAIAAIRFTVTRITDEALRAIEASRPERPDKNYRRFLARLDCLERLGEDGLAHLLFGEGTGPQGNS
jgi:homoserine kinase type II